MSWAYKRQNSSLYSLSELSLSSKGAAAFLPPPKSLHLRAFAKDRPAPWGTRPLPLSTGLSPSWGLRFGASCEVSPGAPPLVSVTASVSRLWAPRAPCGKGLRALVLRESVVSAVESVRVMSQMRVGCKMYRSVT